MGKSGDESDDQPGGGPEIVSLTPCTDAVLKDPAEFAKKLAGVLRAQLVRPEDIEALLGPLVRLGRAHEQTQSGIGRDSRRRRGVAVAGGVNGVDRQGLKTALGSHLVHAVGSTGSVQELRRAVEGFCAQRGLSLCPVRNGVIRGDIKPVAMAPDVRFRCEGKRFGFTLEEGRVVVYSSTDGIRWVESVIA